MTTPPPTPSQDLFAANFSLAGKVALVTGASSGIGAHLAETLARAGAKVFLTARRRNRLEAVRETIEDFGGAAKVLEMDVTDAAQIETVFEAIAEAEGQLDILLNNSGVAASGPMDTVREVEWDHVIDTNLKGVFLVSKAAVPLLEAGSGSIVNIASILGLGVLKGLGAYAASKAGVIQLTRTMALELAPRGVRVNAIAPGYIETDINRAFFASPAGKRMIAKIPAGRLGETADLDGALLTLTGRAGRFMTGSVVVVDGGHSLAMG